MEQTMLREETATEKANQLKMIVSIFKNMIGDNIKVFTIADSIGKKTELLTIDGIEENYILLSFGSMHQFRINLNDTFDNKTALEKYYRGTNDFSFYSWIEKVKNGKNQIL